MSRALAAKIPDDAEFGAKLGQMQHRSRLAVPCRQHYNHVTLPLLGGKMEVTEDRAVFVKSPRAERRLQREQEKQQSRRPETAPELPRIRSPQQLQPVKETPTAGGDWPYDFFAEEDCSMNSCADSCGLSSDHDTDSVGSSSQEDKLQNGVQRRVAEQVLVVNLKQLARKQKMRYGRPSGRTASRATTPSGRGASSGATNVPSLARQQVRDEANKFTELYANTSSILEAHMTLSPPSTRHSVTSAELQAYRRGIRSRLSTPDLPTKSYSVPAYGL